MKGIGVVVVLTGVVFQGCASAPKLAQEERQVQYIIEHQGVTKDQAYSRAKDWFAKNFNDSNKVIRVDDKEQGHIVGKGNLECNELRQFGDVNSYLLHFIMDSTSKDGRSRLIFEGLDIKPEKNQMFANNIDSKGDLEKVKAKCLEPVQSQFAAALKGSGARSNDF